MGNLWSSLVLRLRSLPMGWLGALIGGAASLFGGRSQQKAANAQAERNMQFEREMMLHQNQVAKDMAATQNQFNSAEAATHRNWSSGQAQEARDWNAAQGQIERSFNAQEAATNRNWQEQMSNTQYQRAMQDMKAAGLNPMLAYSQGGAGNLSGSSASTSAPSTSAPSGASASGSAASPAAAAKGHAAQQFNTLSTAVSTALQVQQALAGVANIEAQTNKTNSEAKVAEWFAAIAKAKLGDEFAAGKVARSEITESVSKASESYSRAWGEEHRSETSKIDRDLRALAIPKAKGDAEFHQMMMEMFKGGSQSASGIGGMIKMFVPMLFKMLESK